MGRREFKPGALTAPLPAVLVTVSDGEKTNVITIGWTGILSTHPPRTYISVRPQRHSYKLLKRCGEFVINLTTASQAEKVDFAGIYSGADRDKLAECGFTPVPSSQVTPPTIKECPFALECRVVEVIPMGTHDVFIADIVSVSADESIIDEDGKIRFDRAGLMAYAHGEYFALGESLGKFGFSTKRGKSSKAKSLQKEKRTDDGKSASSTDAHKKKASKSAKSIAAEKRTEVAKTQKNATRGTAEGEKTEKRPFYLDAPRKKGRAAGKKISRGGKK